MFASVSLGRLEFSIHQRRVVIKCGLVSVSENTRSVNICVMFAHTNMSRWRWWWWGSMWWFYHCLCGIANGSLQHSALSFRSLECFIPIDEYCHNPKKRGQWLDGGPIFRVICLSLSDFESALQPFFLDFMAHTETYKDYIVGFQWVSIC